MSCLSCGARTTEVLDLGRLRLPDFLEPGDPPGESYPLRLVMCETCTLLQLGDLVPRDAVIHERYGFTSGLNEANQADLKQNAEYALAFQPNARNVLDIGCNDGTLLSNFPPHIQRWGCDPLLRYDNFAEAAIRNGVQHGDSGWFTPDSYQHGQFDVITSTAMFYALDDPSKFVEGVRHVLATHGVWVIQQNYALDMLRNNVIDNVIHEHVAYYSVRSLQRLLSRYGMQVTDVVYPGDGIKGGCFRALVTHAGARTVNDSVREALSAEAMTAISRPETWTRWGAHVLGELDRTRAYIDHPDSSPAWCYGAGNRGGTLMQLIGAENVCCAVERAEWKIGKVWNSTGLKIVSEEQFRQRRPDCLVVSPWFFRKGFIERERKYLEAGGTMVYPLPHFELVTA